MGRHCFIVPAIASVLISGVSCEDSWTSGRLAVPDAKEEGGFAEPEEDLAPVYYVAGVEYPEGYDWMRDPQHGTVECSMFLMRGTFRCLELSVGYDFEISSYGDMARCVGDHIFTDYSTMAETVIRKDGTEILRYPGREMIKGLTEDEEGNVYTLGVPRDGNGWSFRKNGEQVSASGAGPLTSGLYLDENVPVFGYEVMEEDYYDRTRRYYIVRNGVQAEVKTVAENPEIADFRLWKGSMHVLYSESGKAFVENYGLKTGLELQGMTLSSLECLLADSLAVYAVGKVVSGSGKQTTVWKNGEICAVFDEDVEIVACYPDGKNLGAVGYMADDRSSPVMFRNGEYSRFPSGYGIPDRSFADFTDGHYCIVLVPLEAGRPPVYIIDGETFTLDINGYVFSIGKVWM